MQSLTQRRIIADKLAHYAQRKPKYFLQLDGFYMPDGGDSIMYPDHEGDAIMSGATVELMAGAYVRVLIPPDSDAKIAARQLRKLAEWIEHYPSMLDEVRQRHDIDPDEAWRNHLRDSKPVYVFTGRSDDFAGIDDDLPF